MKQRLDEMKSILEKDFCDWHPSTRRLYSNESGPRDRISSLLRQLIALYQRKTSICQEKTSLCQEKSALTRRLMDTRSLVTVPIERATVEEIDLVKTSGAQFEFVDYQDSFGVLARVLETRLFKFGIQDCNRHPIPLLIDGPGTGKSRFLDEVSKSFKAHVEARKTRYPLLTEALADALIIRVTGDFGQSNPELEICQALAVRILAPYYENANEYVKSWTFKGRQAIEHALELITEKRKRTSSIFLCMDDVTQVHSRSPIDFREIIHILGGMSCVYEPIFVPMFSGNAIEPVKKIFTGTFHPREDIPLPLLSYESSLAILAKASGIPECNPYLRHLVADMGGHPKALEFLLDALQSADPFWVQGHRVEDILLEVEAKLAQMCNLESAPIDGVIATSFLSSDANIYDPVCGAKDLAFWNFAEMGIVKLHETFFVAKVYVPYVFVSASLRCRSHEEFPIVKLWKELLLDQDFWWQDWKNFNRNYFAFRLSLYSYLGHKTLSLESFFTGAKCNLPSDINFVVPPIEAIQVVIAPEQFPDTLSEVKSNVFTLSPPSVPFDAYVYLDTVNKKRILFAFQMTCGNENDVNVSKKVDIATIASDYANVEKAMKKHLLRTEFVLVFVLDCDKATDFNDADIPPGCILITKEEQRALYGKLYYHRLEKF